MFFKLIRMASAACVNRMKSRADLADSIIAQLKLQLAQLKQAGAASVCIEAEKKLKQENESLRKEVENLKGELRLVEIHNGVKQVLPPVNRNVDNLTNGEVPEVKSEKDEVKVKPEKTKEWKTENKATENASNKTEKSGDKEGKAAKPKKTPNKQPPAAVDVKIDVSRLDMRVGHIVSAKKHPNADRLFVEDVNLGEEKHRTVVSGLAGRIPLEQMQDRLAVFMLNLKPAKMQGIQSEGMIMCVSEGETVEILVPPPGSAIGDRVTCPGYEGTPDAQLNPKKKVWEQIKPDMKTNAEKAATYKGAVLSVAGKGPLSAPSLANGQIS